MELNSFLEEKITNIALLPNNKQISFKEDNKRRKFGNLASLFTHCVFELELSVKS